MQSFTKKYVIDAPIEKVWQALTDPVIIEDWHGGPDVIMDDKVGTKFKLWGGDIWGTNTEVKDPTLLKQDWYGDKWPEPSVVTFKLSEEEGKTHLTLVHENIPDGQGDDFDQGWDDYYIGPLIELVEDQD